MFAVPSSIARAFRCATMVGIDMSAPLVAHARRLKRSLARRPPDPLDSLCHCQRNVTDAGHDAQPKIYFRQQDIMDVSLCNGSSSSGCGSTNCSNGCNSSKGCNSSAGCSSCNGANGLRMGSFDAITCMSVSKWVHLQV